MLMFYRNDPPEKRAYKFEAALVKKYDPGEYDLSDTKCRNYLNLLNRLHGIRPFPNLEFQLAWQSYYTDEEDNLIVLNTIVHRRRMVIQHEYSHFLVRQIYHHSNNILNSHGPEFVGIRMIVAHMHCGIPLKELTTLARKFHLPYLAPRKALALLVARVA